MAPLCYTDMIWWNIVDYNQFQLRSFFSSPSHFLLSFFLSCDTQSYDTGSIEIVIFMRMQRKKFSNKKEFNHDNDERIIVITFTLWNLLLWSFMQHHFSQQLLLKYIKKIAWGDYKHVPVKQIFFFFAINQRVELECWFQGNFFSSDNEKFKKNCKNL